jgi:fructokinase
VDDVLVVGEALVDVVERVDGSRVERPGGSPANVALGLARLDRSVWLLTRVGDDDRGHHLRTHLESSGVRLAPGSVTRGRTSTATARLDARGAASYRFDLDWRVPSAPGPDSALALHTGSVAAFLPPGGDEVLALVDRVTGRMTVSYDPNVRPALMGDPGPARDRVEHLVALADLVKVSDEDLAWLAPGEDPEDVVRRWLAAGPAVVVLTRGGTGAVGYTAAGRAAVAAPPVTVTDTVGAGDSFMAGLLDFLAGAGLLGATERDRLHGLPTSTLAVMLEHAARIAAITCTRTGADPPTRAELEHLAPR